LRRPSSRIANPALLLLLCLASCRSKEVSVESIGSPISTPTPQPSVDPRITDLERVKPGTPAPDFALSNHDGTTLRLSDYRGKKHVVMVFYRGYF
jgi:hypothetical protein